MLRLCTGSRLDRLGHILWDHIDTGGKRLRARLALSAAEALGLSRGDAVGWAAACELLHNASLVHDDLQDGDRRRRGREVVWVRHGVAQAINAGDLGLMLPTSAIGQLPVSGETKWRLSQTLSEAAQRVVRGQSAELDLHGREMPSWDDYAHAVGGKTSALFSLPVEGAAILAGLSEADARALAEEFSPVGLLFQVQDDVLDLYGDKGRGEVGSDLREGKVSALVVEHLRLHPAEAPWLWRVLRTPREETTDHMVEETIQRFSAGGALASVWRRLANIDDNITDSPTLTRHPRLHTLASELVARALAPIIQTNPHQMLREWA